MPSRFTILAVCFTMFTAGILSANYLVSALDLSLSTDRTYFVNQITQSIKPLNQQTATMQHAIYQTRINILKKQTETMELKTKSVQQYIEPLEKELNDYRMAFSEKAATNVSERLQLYINLVSKYRDYQRAMSSLDTFIPTKESDSLLSAPSVQLDIVYRTGGELARTHNKFLDEPRDSSFAANFEPKLRQALNEHKLESLMLECHTKTCAVHMGQRWDGEYYQGYEKIWQDLQTQSWMSLVKVAEGHQYRGKGIQIQVWYLEYPQ